MSITIKEIVVRTNVDRCRIGTKGALNSEEFRKLKQDIVKEVIRIQEKKSEWEKEW